MHPFKSGQATTSIQALGNTVTLAQVLPARTQTLVYSTGANGAQFATAPRLSVANTIQSQRQPSITKPVVCIITICFTLNNTDNFRLK